MKKSIAILASTVLLLQVGGLAFAGNGYKEVQHGREPAVAGRASDNRQLREPGSFDPDSKATLVGRVYFDETEWKIETDQGTFSIQIGNQRFAASTGMEMHENEDIAVFGYVDENDVFPILIVIGEEAFYLRDTDGTPLWTGRRVS